MNTKHSHTNHSRRSADLTKTAETMMGRAGDRLSAVLENTRQFASNARTKAVATAKATDKAVKANPYKALAIATGVGLALGMLMGRRRSAPQIPE